MLEYLAELDKAWFLRVNGFHGGLCDHLMKILSFKHSWILYLPFLYLIFRKTGWKKAFYIVLGVLLTFAVTDLAAARIFKPFFKRLRPCHEPGIRELAHVVDGCGGSFGFISNHSANHFGLAVFFGMIFQQYYPGTMRWFLLFAFIVSYSRVYMGVHYPGDVLVGGAFGALTGYVLFRLYGLLPKSV